MTKFALPALVLVIFGLFYFAAPQTPYEPVDVATPVAAPAPASPTVAEPAKEPAKEPIRDERQQQFSSAIDSIRAELNRLSDDAKATNEKIAQAAALRSDVENSKASIDSAVRDQIGALRADQTRALNEAKEAGDKTAQALRQELTASQGKLADQFDQTLKANAARAEALSQRVDAMRKDVDEIKKNIDESRDAAFNVSPGLALIVALAALVLGPFVARQLTANQLAAAAKQRAEADAATEARRNQASAVMNAPLAPSSAPSPSHEDLPHSHDAPTTDEAPASHHDDDPPPSQDREKA